MLMQKYILMFLLALTIGCGQQSEDSVATAAQPLTVDEWKLLEVTEKYAPETFDRLKLNDPKLKDERSWDMFMRDVVVPERKKDIPTEY